MYSSIEKFTKKISVKEPLFTLTYLVTLIDYFRSSSLKFILKKKFIRRAYCNRAFRLSTGYTITFIVCAPLSILRPDLLLVLGPLFYGFFHLVSSYYYCLRPKKNLRSTIQSFHFFGFLTLAIVLFKATFFYHKTIFNLPNGLAALILVSLSFIILMVWQKKLFTKPIILIVFINCIIINYAWFHPLLFLSATLFIHNWIAFIYWFVKSKTNKDKTAAIFGTICFILFNILIIYGHLDHHFPDLIKNELLAANGQSTAWALAPWTSSSIVAQRALSLYTLGLSLHYFIWLKAIPQNLQVNQVPPSFRASLKVIELEVGRKAIITIILTFLVSAMIWLYSFPLGSYIYFLLAGLHFWIELFGLLLSKDLGRLLENKPR